jgi:hypothetical protein
MPKTRTDTYSACLWKTGTPPAEKEDRSFTSPAVLPQTALTHCRIAAILWALYEGSREENNALTPYRIVEESMSLISLAERKVKQQPSAAVAHAAANAAAADDTSAKTISDALSAVAAYVPSEVIAIYTLTIATTVSPKAANGEPGVLPLSVFFAFLFATPLLEWLVFVVHKIETDHNRDILRQPLQWPYWEATAATIAFAVWSATMPRSAFSNYNWYSPNISGIVLVVVSLLLPLVGGLFRKP